MAKESRNSDRDRRPEGISKHGLELPVLGAVSMDRRQALKVMAIAAATPALVSCKPGEEASEILMTPASASKPEGKRRCVGSRPPHTDGALGAIIDVR